MSEGTRSRRNNVRRIKRKQKQTHGIRQIILTRNREEEVPNTGLQADVHPGDIADLRGSVNGDVEAVFH